MTLILLSRKSDKNSVWNIIDFDSIRKIFTFSFDDVNSTYYHNIKTTTKSHKISEHVCYCNGKGFKHLMMNCPNKCDCGFGETHSKLSCPNSLFD